MVFAQNDPTDLVQFGVLGVVLLLVLLGWLWAKPSVDQLKADKARVEAQRDALVEAYQTEIIPILRDAALGTAKAVEVAQTCVPLLTRVEAKMELLEGR